MILAGGLIHQRTLDHQRDDVRVFYTQFPVPAIVGLEATGYARWFHRLLESLGHRLLVGDAYVIRKCALRRQKNDRRDAELLLDLLLHGDFPAAHTPNSGAEVVKRDVPGNPRAPLLVAVRVIGPSADAVLRGLDAQIDE